MSKDPAFLFYSKDFYEGTRTMLPKERACYIDLLIYQHQNGIIPNDLERIVMYCNGIDEATLKATLKAKFKQTDLGWENERLNKSILERENYKNKQSESGKLGQFWKKSKAILNEKDFKSLQILNSNKLLILDFINENEININTLKGLLKHRLNNKAIVNENENAIVNKEKRNVSEKEIKISIPDFSEFLIYAKEKEPSVLESALKNKYDAWIENGWKDGNDKVISKWKVKLLNTMPFIEKEKSSAEKEKPMVGRMTETAIKNSINAFL